MFNTDIVLHTYAYLIPRDLYELRIIQAFIQETYFRSFVSIMAMCYSILIIVQLREYNLSIDNLI